MQTAVRVLAILAIAFYTIPLLIISPLLNILPARYVEEHYGRQLDTEWVVLNPFKLSLDISRAQLSEVDGTPFLALADTSVNLSLASLWRQGFVLDELRVHDVSLRLAHLGENEFNFSDLMPPPAEEPPEDAEAAPPPGVTIHLLDVHAARIALHDEARDLPLDSEWTDLQFQVRELSTVREDGDPFTFHVRGPGGGSLRWEGEVSIPAAHSDGRVEIAGLNLHNLWRLAAPWVTFEVRAGTLDLGASYTLDWSGDLGYGVEGASLALHDVDLAPQQPQALPETSMALTGLRIAPVNVDGAEQRASVGEIAIDGLQLQGWSEGTRVSLAEMFTGPGDPNAPAAAPAVAAADPNSPAVAGAAPPQDTAAGTGWRASIDAVALRDSAVNWRSQYTDPPRLAVTPIQARIAQLTWPLSGESPFTLSLTVNDQASFSVDGTLALGAGDGAVNYQLRGLPVAWGNPNLPDNLNASFSAGELGVAGAVELAAWAPARVTLDGGFAGVEASWNDSGEVFSSLQRLQLDGLDVDLAAHTLAAQTLTIDQYNGRLHIYQDGSINMSRAFAEEYADEAAQVADNVEEQYGEGEPWSYRLPALVISDSSVDFMDQSLPIPFRTQIGDVNGQVQGIDSRSGEAARVEINGSVAGSAPVALAGSVNPFADPLGLDLALTFDGMDMALLSPYSATYAGYAIDSGLLNLDLEYKLDSGRLAGNNRIVLDQLQLGEKVESDKAIDVPLQLALSIMTDSQGVIDMKVPVSGDVDDPSFALGSVIGKALVGVITKAVTAPFTLLGNLVGSDEDLQHVAFPTGSAQPDQAARDKLAALGEALAQRPQIKLRIDGRVNAAADARQLQQDALTADLLRDGLSQQSVDDRDEDWAAAIEQRFAALPAGEDTQALTVRDKHAALAASYPVDAARLAELAQARAVAVKSFLVNEAGMAAERAVIGRARPGDEANRFSGVELGIN
ncbi:MAG: hypothetical protein CME59_10575 [Halioglobus sp.]|nr:hypothetical protein [Halioglobus sp.]